MGPETYALLERVHGHLGVLGLAVLLHPILQLRRGMGRWTQLTADLGAALTALPFAIGWAIYPTYRAHVKPALWVDHVGAALRFESKEHLALLTVAFTVSGAMALRSAGRTAEGRRVARALLLAGWCCGVLTGVLGIYVASVAQPGW